jgi:DNA repair exonuclease SbcCD ATPase subunit
MKLLSLQAHNVFSIGDITLTLKDRGLVLVTGWSYDEKNGNMAGKSSVANHCISWGLYGRTVHGIKADAVINTSIPHAKHCGVTLTFEGIDGETYRIYRARKPNCLVLSKYHKFNQTGDGLLDEWEDLSKRNEKDTQAMINSLLGRDHKTFIQSDFFGQGRERSFLALPGSDQKAVIEEILPLNSLEAWKDKAKAELKLKQAELAETGSEQRTSNDLERMALAHLHTLQSQGAGWTTNNATDYSSAQQKLNEIQAIDMVIEKEIAELRDRVPPGKTEDVLRSQNAIESKLTSEISSLGYRIDTLTGDIDRRAARPDVCGSCEQTLPPELLILNRDALLNDKMKREELVKERGEQEAKHYLAASMIAICGELQGLEAQLVRKGEEAALKAKVKLFTEAINPFAQLIIAAEKEYSTQTDKSELLRLQSVEQAKAVAHYKFWANAYGADLKTLIFNQVCPFLERKTNEYLRSLDNAQIKVKFRTVKVLKSGDARDQFCVTAASDTGSTVFELFSGAEKQLTSFAVGMALSELASMQTEGASSFMILDEPFLYQSPENCERIINFVTTHLVGDKATILLISNEDNLVNLVPNRVHVVKKKGVTSIA